MSDTPNLDAIEAEVKAAILSVYLNLYESEHKLDSKFPVGRPNAPACSVCETQTGYHLRKNTGGVRSTVWKICSDCDNSAAEGEIIMVHIVMRRELVGSTWQDSVDKVFTHYFDADHYAKLIGGYVVSRDLQDFKTERVL